MSSLYLETLPDEKLLSELNDCILNERYFDAIGVGSIIELAYHENAITIPDEMDFFCRYILCFMLGNDVEGAYHLWRRVPLQFKNDTTQIAALWNISKELWKENIEAAYKAMKFNFSPLISTLVGKLHTQICQSQLQLISKAYSSIHETEMMMRLNMTSDCVRSKCFEMGWEISPSGFISPMPIEIDEDDSGVNGVHDSIDMMIRMADFVSHFEKKPIVETKLSHNPSSVA